MKGDYSRDTFDPAKQFIRVLMQQGRVQLDADSNEQTSILLYYLQSLARDLIGPAGGPKDFLGFEIMVLGQTQADLKVQNFTIGLGRYYVDGLLVESILPAFVRPGTETVRFGAPESTTTTDTEIGRLKAPQLSYYEQPSYPLDPELNPLKMPFLVYLDVWERHLCYVEDPDIREVALQGPDTAARSKIVWQVKTALVSIEVPEQVTCTGFEKSDLWKRIVGNLQAENRGHLKARANAPTDSDEPCLVAPEARYRGEENQLYRVEVHRAGVVGDINNGATFKWSRENGSVVFPIQTREGRSVTLENLGRDDRFSLEIGDWVEVVDDDYTLLNKAEPLLRVEDIDRTSMRITLSAAPQGTVGEDVNKHPLVRRWDQQEGNPTTGGLKLANGSALIVESNSSWLSLEDGIQIQFQSGARYRTGDYWLIPARTETGDVEWPGPVGEPRALPPHGVEHHYAPLALVFSKPTALGPGFGVTDLRHRFAPAGQCCPTITLDYPSQTTAQSTIRFELRINPAVKDLTFEWAVTGGTKADVAGRPFAIDVKVTDLNSVTAKVTIKGLPPYCQNEFEGTAIVTSMV